MPVTGYQRQGKRTIGLALTGALLCGPAWAQWEAPQPVPPGFNLQPSLSETLSWDSNPLMLAQGEEDIFGSVTTLGLLLTSATPLTTLTMDTQVTQNLFDDADYNSTDLHEKIALTRRNEQWTLGLNGGFDYDTTRTSELTNYGLNLPSVRRTAWSLGPQLSYRLSETEKLSFNASYMNTAYSSDAFVDYRLMSATASYSHAFNPRHTGLFMLQAQRYESEQTRFNADSTTDSFGPSLGWLMELTPRLSARLMGGFLIAETDGAPGTTDEDLNYIFSAGLTYRGEQDVLTLVAERARQPFGNGTETLLTTFRVNDVHHINERVSVNAGASYRYADYDNPPGVNLDYEARGDVGLSYKLTQEFDLTVDYSYRTEELTNLPGTIEQNIVLVGLRYHPFAKGL